MPSSRSGQRFANSINSKRFNHPGFLVVVAFLLFILIGGSLLSLPVSQHATATPPTTSDAYFTAASAVTVTGLGVVDTGTTWSPFGEVVLLVMIQIGGLGIMTFAGFLGISLSRRLGIRGGMLAGQEIGLTELGVVRMLVKNLVISVALAESVIAVLLTGRFLLEGEHGVIQSAHLGIFHSVSAFNNAGFSIFEGGMTPYAGDWFVNIVIAGAFIGGGIGFPVMFDLARNYRTPRRWTLHTKVTLSTTAVLLAAGTLAVGLGEWTNPDTLGTRPIDERILASFFQSATARTAGFNTIDIGSLRDGTLLVFIPLMVIGAGSASTGGGIKVSSLAVVIRAMIAEFRGDPTTTMFERRVPDPLQRQALSLVIAALTTIGAATVLLTWLHEDIAGLELLFEAASAFGTVGVSTGVTGELNQLGRLLIIVLMFVGRVGPITFGTAFLLRGQSKRYGFAEEQLLVG